MIDYCTHNKKKLILATILFILLDVSFMLCELPVAADADSTQSVVKIDEQRVIGRWVRPDGGYTLELKEIKKDGTLKAAYFNPRPINVARAEINRKEGGISIVIELRDVNYPGSTYNLRYDPKTDKLIGTYFQAVQKETYDIEFMRAK
jgi:hypothetical protein